MTVDINGHHINALSDSGAEMSVLSTKGAHFAGVTVPAAVKQQGVYISGLGEKRAAPSVAKLDTFEFDQEKIMNTPIVVADLFSGNREVATGNRLARNGMDFPDMLLGSDFFRSHRVFLAKSEGKGLCHLCRWPRFPDRNDTSCTCCRLERKLNGALRGNRSGHLLVSAGAGRGGQVGSLKHRERT